VQTVKGSLIEAWTNIVVGFTISFVANMLIFPLFGWATFDTKTNLTLGFIYTVISLVRSFVLRRIFTRIRSHHVAD
jgi:hypothetical protein